MRLFSRNKRVRIRVFEEDKSIYLRSRSFVPAGSADYDTICDLLKKMGFKDVGRS